MCVSVLKQKSSYKGRESSQHPIFQQLVSPKLLTDVHFDNSSEAEIPFLH